MHLSEATKRRVAKKAFSAATIWWAACESGHILWSGPERDTYLKAQADATAHDNSSHGGEPTAAVLNTR